MSLFWATACALIALPLASGRPDTRAALLPEGSRPPAFALPDAGGKAVSLRDFLGPRRIVLLFGPSHRFLHDAQKHRAGFAERDLMVLAIRSSGGAEATETVGVHVLHDSSGRVTRAYGAAGHETAFYLIGKDGHIAVARRDTPTCQELFATIDAMPMRQREMRERHGYSGGAMATRETILRTVEEVIAAGPFAADWDSLKQYQIPTWYEDAKFGIFIHWGLYCVPAFGSEWYPRQMYQEGSREFQHHAQTYGPQSQFGYKDFLPQFRAERFDPQGWASLFADSGAKFVMPVAEHHDGFPMYDTDLSEWSAAKKGPMRDVVGELADAVRREGLVFTASSHRAEHCWFFDGGKKFASDVQDPRFGDFYGPAQPGPSDHGSLTDAPPNQDFLEDWLARTCEIVDKYRPQILWFDWWIQHQAFEPYLQKLAAFYYNRGAQWGLGVAINYKYNAYPEGSAVLDIERGQLAGIRPLLWQNDTSVSKNSWGYIEGQDYKTVTSIIGDLIDVVSKNGALLLNIGPKADGSIPEEEQQMLREIGQWLRVNGEAIYGSRPWTVFGEGPTEVAEGAFTDTKRAEFTGQDIRFTIHGDALYALTLAWPGDQVTIHSLAGRQVGGVTLLGHDGPLTWTPGADGLTVRLPAQRPCGHAYALKITGC